MSPAYCQLIRHFDHKIEIYRCARFWSLAFNLIFIGSVVIYSIWFWVNDYSLMDLCLGAYFALAEAYHIWQWCKWNTRLRIACEARRLTILMDAAKNTTQLYCLIDQYDALISHL
jgi:hypothetical protein